MSYEITFKRPSLRPRTNKLLSLGLVGGLLWTAGCGSETSTGNGGSGPPPKTVVTDISLVSISPGIVVPGSELVLKGGSFVPAVLGASELRLSGSFAGEQVDVTLPARFVDYDEMVVDWPGGMSAGLASDEGTWQVEAIVEASNTYDGLRHQSKALTVTLDVRYQLTPQLDAVQGNVVFVNDYVQLSGDAFLLGGNEGTAMAIVEGCFTLDGAKTCDPITTAEIVTEPVNEFDRTLVRFPFAPRIAGIAPGTFTGTVKVENRHSPEAGAAVLNTETSTLNGSIVEPVIFSFSPSSASLGQYVDVGGSGFVGITPSDSTTALTTIILDGTFTPEGQSTGTPVILSLIPEFVSGQLVRYVVNEEDQLGQALDLRKEAGQFAGVARPEVQYGTDTVTGSNTTVSLGIDHVKQVVWIRFLPAYIESLRNFGLRAVEPQIRERIFATLRDSYGGLNLDFRNAQPTDYALYSEVELSGTDPNGLGLLGYDNTHGKDENNKRLWDKIGGVNALTQEGGYPGYGGVFVESLFAFSMHPGSFAQSVDGADEMFDQLYDPFRPDIGGTPVSAADVALGIVPLSSGDGCPAAASDRPSQIACAIWTLGSMIGTITAHEIGHSLGLADPGGSLFHNTGDWLNALMDSGYARGFRERSEVMGEGPGLFCRHNFDYLFSILPTSIPDPHPDRLECY